MKGEEEEKKARQKDETVMEVEEKKLDCRAFIYVLNAFSQAHSRCGFSVR